MNYDFEKKTYDLRKEKVEKVAKENDLKGEVSRIALVIDSSGSMGELYRNGTVQEVIKRILPIAATFDDNKELDCWIFGDKYCRLPNIMETNYLTYVSTILIPNSNKAGGGTSYAPVMYDISKRYVSEEPIDYPSYVIFITDGENSDRKDAEGILKELSKRSIFFQFIGIGGGHFSFLESLDTMVGRFIDNANFFALNDLNNISDDELYQRLLTEYPLWIKEARNKNILKQKGSDDAFSNFLNNHFK